MVTRNSAPNELASILPQGPHVNTCQYDALLSLSGDPNEKTFDFAAMERNKLRTRGVCFPVESRYSQWYFCMRVVGFLWMFWLAWRRKPQDTNSHIEVWKPTKISKLSHSFVVLGSRKPGSHTSWINCFVANIYALRCAQAALPELVQSSYRKCRPCCPHQNPFQSRQIIYPVLSETLTTYQFAGANLPVFLFPYWETVMSSRNWLTMSI